MKFFNRALEFYVFANLHVAFSVLFFVLCTGLLFEIVVFYESLFLSVSTFLAYHFIRYNNRFRYQKTHRLAKFSSTYKRLIFILVIVALILDLLLLFKFTKTQYFCVLGIIGGTLIYALPFFKIKGKPSSIRYFSGLKIFVIAMVWSVSIVIFPLGFHYRSFIYLIEIFLFVIVLTLPFDIRDLDFDEASVKTLPKLLGEFYVKLLGLVILIITILIHAFLFSKKSVFAFGTVCLVLLLLLIFSKEKQSKYYASFWVESVPIIYFVVLKLFA